MSKPDSSPTLLRAKPGGRKGQGQDVPKPPGVNQVNSQVAPSYPNPPEGAPGAEQGCAVEMIIYSGRQNIQFTCKLDSQYLWLTLLWSSAQHIRVLLLMRALHLWLSPEGHWSAEHPT